METTYYPGQPFHLDTADGPLVVVQCLEPTGFIRIWHPAAGLGFRTTPVRLRPFALN